MLVQSVSAWQQMDNWRKSQGAFNQQFTAVHDAVNSALMGTMGNYYNGLASLATNAALKRIQAATQAKLAALQSSLPSTLGQNVNKVA